MRFSLSVTCKEFFHMRPNQPTPAPLVKYHQIKVTWKFIEGSDFLFPEVRFKHPRVHRGCRDVPRDRRRKASLLAASPRRRNLERVKDRIMKCNSMLSLKKFARYYRNVLIALERNRRLTICLEDSHDDEQEASGDITARTFSSLRETRVIGDFIREASTSPAERLMR